jgi:predicted DNA-binding protein (MmcQ/YjbR family)
MTSLRQKILRYAGETYHTEPEYLWMKYPGYAVLRHLDNQKWYAIVMDAEPSKIGRKGEERIDILDVKCDPAMISSLLGNEGFLPGYHMNKTAWISILLDGSVSEEKIYNLMDLSFRMTGPRESKQ